MTLTELAMALQKLPESMKNCDVKLQVENHIEDLSDIMYSPRNNTILLMDYVHDE